MNQVDRITHAVAFWTIYALGIIIAVKCIYSANCFESQAKHPKIKCMTMTEQFHEIIKW